MNVEYCSHCGHKNIYSATAPNFCAGCGKPLREQMQANHSVEKKAEEEVSDEIPQLTSLAYEVEMDSGNKKLTLGDVMREGVRTYGEGGPPEEGASSMPGRKKAPEGQSFSKADLLKDGLNSCRSARGQLSQEIEE